VVPPTAGRGARRSVYFPGSTIGNLTPEEAVRLLGRAADIVGPGGGLLIGIDLRKDPLRIEAAYNDSAGLTAAFNLNLLVRANRELGADFRLTRFQHRAFYDRTHGRIEMHLVSLARQRVSVGGRVFAFGAGETILTEYSYKYEIDQFAALAAQAGFDLRRTWTDASRLFGVLYLETPPTTLRGLC
ncbi:MAG TPA: L-histidine N(alpha)-methyltransferase, partial [Candidatus Polarisedimenticolia bacterium]|nr:L-histidine N(alpha)-methyltransferase [Candidatus Polarisedimenticolia bacterium]